MFYILESDGHVWPEAHVLASVKLKIAKLLKMRLKTLELHSVQLGSV